ncbi:MAG: hypothetical protein IKE16_03945 [Solobacterium sp.]|nr:hypothetical protein [Solobacterium sp.]
MTTEGFVLSDALVAIAVVSVCCTVTAAALGVITRGETLVNEVYDTSAEMYEETLSGIGECVCEVQEEITEPTDTSSNSS